MKLYQSSVKRQQQDLKSQNHYLRGLLTYGKYKQLPHLLPLDLSDVPQHNEELLDLIEENSNLRRKINNYNQRQTRYY